MAIFTFVEDRRGGRKRYAVEARQFEQHAAEAAVSLGEAFAREREARRSAAPGAVALVGASGAVPADAVGASRGRSRLPAPAAGDGNPGRRKPSPDPGQRQRETFAGRRKSCSSRSRRCRRCPSSFSLPEAGALGISGPRQRSMPLARWLVVQAAATLQSPRDLVIAAVVRPRLRRRVVVAQVASAHAQRCLPTRRRAHRRDHRGRTCTARAGARRWPSRAATPPGRSASDPQLLLLLDNEAELERPIVSEILRDEAATGITAIWIGERTRDLPGECGAVAELDSEVATLIVHIVAHARTPGGRLSGRGADPRSRPRSRCLRSRRFAT